MQDKKRVMSEIELNFPCIFMACGTMLVIWFAILWMARPQYKEWRVLYDPGGKLRFIGPQKSIAMYKSVALDYMEIFNDAVCIEKIRGRGKGKKIYKKRKK